ncbi:thiamine ABC transporter substrate-binding protein [Cellulomonas bogoriensis]|uniref:ABC transporter substrate-binding protein n=1 Tax=Cellulomonas bogoriensis 69B4 = DSM 16987 TaxID=1386082 RepID=A0A0A0BPX6_9CELL|nr:thiamine ABC transporter substrate-binding protein [Cellulomonas bogoriensis]KGM10538.1 ABC transporter substrate-binding protein [Cellulomonas bogoriensis 69B4 = DSM 16987]
MASTLAHTPHQQRPSLHGRRRRALPWLAVTVTGALLAGCTTVGTDTPDDDATGAPDGEGGTVVLITHDSFALSEERIADFEASTGLTLEQRAPGDGGSLVNQLILTQDAPLGDVVYGIDNTFASRAIAEGVLEPYTSPAAGDDATALGVDDAGHLTAINVGDVCLNIDHQWFDDADVPEPTTLADLTDPAYADLVVVTNPATSSPGLAFLLATIAEFGEDGWQDYWTDLRDNGLHVAAGWSDAYYVDFSGSSGEGDRPIALSYASSPPYEVTDEDAEEGPTSAMLDTCFRQVEYAGVLAGAQNPDGARQVIDWLLSPEVQADIPENMYVFPVDTTVELPEAWARFAPVPEDPYTLDPADIDANRDDWIQEWTELVIG